MDKRLYPHDDFEATIRIYSFDEGGRQRPVFNGIRWDFVYAGDQSPSNLYMIHPDFFIADGRSLPPDQPLPIGVELHARMMVVVEEMRQKVHRRRIAPGVRFYCVEGLKRVAEGVVTKVTGLHNDRSE